MISPIRLFGFSLFLSIFIACSDHNPDNPLNPESGSYVGDSLAQLDADSNDVADILEQSSSSDQGLSSSSAPFSSIVLISSAEETSSAQATNSAEALSSGAESSSTASLSNGGESSVNPTSSQAFSSDAASSSSSENSSSSAIPLYVLTVEGGVLQNDSDSGSFAEGTPITVNLSLGENECFTSWTSNVDLGIDSTADTLSFTMPAHSVSLTAEAWACLIDSRDSNIYAIKAVSSLTWMTENLRYAPTASATTCRSGSETSQTEADCDSTGRYYTWAGAMGLDALYDSTDTVDLDSQGVCPEGWRLPTVSEFAEANESVSLDLNGVLKGSSFVQFDTTGFYWTLEPYDSLSTDFCDSKNTAGCGVAWIHKPSGSVSYYQGNNKTEGLGVRCVQ
ncbi:MAG TPA: FISUMP domain-containing protein [Fibrobacteraceae bacterium]|nr:FISUMP domain-containing protein [Fibrobacteraceae bacterium]